MSESYRSPAHQAQNREQIFIDYLDGKLSPKEKIKFEQSIANEPLWQQRLNTANFVENQAQTKVEQNVPSWNRTAAFVSNKQPWWQWQGLPAISMVFSCFALALVVFKVNIQVNDNGLLVNFGHTNSTEQALNKIVTQQVSDKLNQQLRVFASEQQVILTNFSADLRLKQQADNLQLASYIMATSRKERNEDINDFIIYINEQNREDKLDQKLQLQQLKYAIENHPDNFIKSSNILQPINYKIEE
jgi:hypothetical protein